MKIAITGHTAGIGQALANILLARGHEIIGISRRTGENIRRIKHTANLIEPCELFINNAQTLYAQTELFYEVWQKWRGIPKKYIWNISTQMTEQPINGAIEGMDDIVMSAYRNQKIALEEASRQLRFKNSWPHVTIIRPGSIATYDKFNMKNRADVKQWAKSIIDIFSHNENISISEISVGYTTKRIAI